MRQATHSTAIDKGPRACLRARFPKAPQWAPPAPAGPSPWELIRQVLAKGRADGLDDIQLAGAVAVLTSHGLMDGGRA
ncbi:hypothetical protein Y590_09090 [Methylobacterium sp. AMS5]|nr:hypothetical protein Y590_09090 [Methylobacterium sp. AMS5]